jgi:hypothetical protein
VPILRDASVNQVTAMELVHNVKAWTMQHGEQGKVILTFSTADQGEISFSVSEEQVHQMADLIVEHEVEAYPTGIEFR